jgi:hypothetical protein
MKITTKNLWNDADKGNRRYICGMMLTRETGGIFVE